MLTNNFFFVCLQYRFLWDTLYKMIKFQHHQRRCSEESQGKQRRRHGEFLQFVREL